MIRLKEDWYDEWGLERPDDVEVKMPDFTIGDTVKCAGYEWYVIDWTEDDVTLLAKNLDFGNMIFDKKSNDYETSEIRKYLNRDILPKLQDANPISTDLPDVGVTDKIWLLSIEEAESLPLKIRRFGSWWWLRSPGSKSYYELYVDSRGSLDDPDRAIVYMFHGSVRPAMRVHIEDLDVD